MKTSEKIDVIAPALLKAQRAIDAVVKDQTGKIVTKTGATYEYKYSNLASVLDEVKAPLNEQGIVILQTPAADISGVTVTTTLLHEGGQWIEESLFMPVVQGTPQAYGSAITYCRRYSLQSIIGLKSEEDDDGKTGGKNYTKHTARQVAVDALEGMGEEEQKFLQNHAMQIIATHEAGGDLHAYLITQKFDAEEKLALWSLLPANVRSTIKKQETGARNGRHGIAVQGEAR
jgi:hypothetical protein